MPLSRRSLSGQLLAALVATAVIGIWVSAYPARSREALVHLVLGLLAFVLSASLIRTMQHVRWITQSLVLAGLALACLAIAPRVYTILEGLPSLDPMLDRLSLLTPAFNPNVAAGGLVVLLPFAIGGIMLPSERVWVRASSGIAAGIVAAAILASGSTGAIVGALVSVIVLVAVHRQRALWWIVLGTCIAGVLTGVTLGWHELARRLTGLAFAEGLDVRMEIWSRAWDIVCDFPLTGAGLGCFEQVVRSMYPLFLVKDGTVTHAHNLYLQVAVDLGLVGLASYLAILGESVRRLVKRLSTELDHVAAVCLASIGGLLSHGIIDASTWDNKIAFLPWIVLGLSLAITQGSNVLTPQGQSD